MNSIKNFKNPDTFFGRFLCHFALAFSACLVTCSWALSGLSDSVSSSG